MMVELADSLILASPYALLPALLCGIVRFGRAPVHIRVVMLLVFISSVFTFISALLWYRRVNNLPLLHVYTVLEFSLLSVFYARWVRPHASAWLLLAVIPLFVVLSIGNSLFVQNIGTHNSYTRGLEAFLAILYALWMYYRSFRDQADASDRPALLVSTAYFIYFSACFFLFVLSNRISMSPDLRHIFWGVHAVFVFVLYGILTVAFYKVR